MAEPGTRSGWGTVRRLARFQVCFSPGYGLKQHIFEADTF